LEDFPLKLDYEEFFDSLILVRRSDQSPIQFPLQAIMKANRLLESPEMITKESLFNGGGGIVSRGFITDQTTKITPVAKRAEISSALSNCFADEVEGVFRLEDEFSAEDIAKVVAGCRSKISRSPMTGENWQQVGAYLADDLWELSRLKEDLILAERKCGMVQQKANHLSQPVNGKVNKNRLMACAMLIAEVEMRRDHLQARISHIVDSFVERILADFEGSAEYRELELRLRAVFSSL